MSDHTSILKARYCRSILTTASNSSDEDARHLIDCLATEIPTPGTSPRIRDAEKAALLAIDILCERLQDRSASSLPVEWKTASAAVLYWIAAKG